MHLFMIFLLFCGKVFQSETRLIPLLGHIHSYLAQNKLYPIISGARAMFCIENFED